jgi:phosphomannomutase
MSVFKAYDIRGVYNQDFDKYTSYKIGYYLPDIVDSENALIGYDIRKSSPEIFEYLAQGLIDRGIEVFSMALASTPSVYFNTADGDFDLSIQITASHNSKEYNGMKISKRNALPIGYDTGLDQLEELVNKSDIQKEDIIIKDVDSEVNKYHGQFKYLSFLKRHKPNIEKLDVIVDASNGMASLFLKDIFGENVKYINEKMDGDFPGHDPNPMNEENLDEIKSLIHKENYDVGVVYDGDADRVIFLDENGKFISPDLITAILAEYFLKENTKQLRVFSYTSNELNYATPTSVDETCIVVTASLGGTTPETVEASKKAKKLGAHVISLTKEKDSPLANVNPEHLIVHGFGDNYASKLEKMTINLKIAVELLNQFEGYKYYDKMINGFDKIYENCSSSS